MQMKTHEIGRDKLQLEQLIGSQSATELVSSTEYSVQTKGVGHIREVQYSVLSPLFLHGIIVALGQNSMLPVFVGIYICTTSRRRYSSCPISSIQCNLRSG